MTGFTGYFFCCNLEVMSEIKFLVDENLLGLLRKLRMLGIDSVSMLSAPDEKLLELAHHQNRVLLTQDQKLSQQIQGPDIYLVQAVVPRIQLLEVLKHFALDEFPRALTRCTDCNHLLHEISKDKLKGRVEAKTLNLYEEFYECSRCQKIYWKGSHFRKMLAEIVSLKARLRGEEISYKKRSS
jgi:uncharacterized protein with PIN domain